MRICHVITRLIIGGAQENTLLSCRGLAKRGHEVTLLAGPESGAEGSLWERTRGQGFEALVVEELRRAVNPWRDWRALRRLRARFREIKPDVVHTHSSKAGIVGRFAARSAGVPVVVHTIHGMSFNRTQSWATRFAYRALERSAARRTTAFVAVADAMTDQAVAAHIAERSSFVTIRSGIETAAYRPSLDARREVRREWGVADDDIVVGTIARLFANKGYDEIISAMSAALTRMPKLLFVWVGDGSGRARYERTLVRMGLHDRVRFTGLVDPADVPRLVNGFDIALHASRWEGLPRALVQALLVEVPAISFDNDGAAEVVIPDETGILVPFGDTRLLGDAILRLADEPELRRAFGRAGRARCLREFDAEKTGHELSELYHRLVSLHSVADTDEIGGQRV